MTPTGDAPIRLRVFPDYFADPVWMDTGMADLGELPVSDTLRFDLREWAMEWEALMGSDVRRYAIEDASRHETWQRRGALLAGRLQRELGSSYAVEYVA